jgi:hypothetical protein
VNVAVLAAMVLVAGPVPVPDGVRVVMPASGVRIDGLPRAARWEVEGTVLVSQDGQAATDWLHAWALGGEREERLASFEIARESCPPMSPMEAAPWPTLGYEGTRAALPGELAVRSCKAPDLMVTVRFPAGTGRGAEELLEAADRWEPVIAAIHRAYSERRVELAEALGNRERLTLKATDAGGAEVVAALGLPMTIGLYSAARVKPTITVERGADRVPWVVRKMGAHEYLSLIAPTGAGVLLQLVPFDVRSNCEAALEQVLKGQPPAANGAVLDRIPPGWTAARPVGAESAAFCIWSARAGGLIAMGGGRVAREAWLPVAMPMLGRIGEALLRR